MANFTTHIAVGIVASGVVSTLVLAGGLVTETEVLTLVGAGAVGAVLPDIDLQKSRASQAMFSGLAVFLAFAVLLKIGMQYSLAEMWLMWAGTYLLVRYGGHNLFHAITEHRGIFHSLLAGIAFGLVTTILFSKLLGTSDIVAWLGGLFMLFGYIVHLVLDEIYSVDVLNERIKSSFGSALKLFDSHAPVASASMAAVIVGLFLLTPPAKPIVSLVGSHDTWTYLHHRMLPEGKWFGVFGGERPVSTATVTAPAGGG
ncbi:MAG: metal-dependent hydrolase [Hyphomicrobiaceae bacterium]